MENTEIKMYNGVDMLIGFATGTMADPDDRAFMEELCQNYKWLMFSTVQKYISNSADQKDVMQDSMEKLMKKVSTLRPMARCSLASYIVYTIRSTSIDFLRAQKRNVERNISLDVPEFLELEAVDPPLDDLIISAQQSQRLQSVWPDLSEEERTLLDGKYILGYTDKELASRLGCQPSSIRMKLTRARRRAFERLAEKEEVEL